MAVYTTNNDIRVFRMVENYIYLYHVNKFIVLPAYPDTIQDSMPVTYTSATPLGRSAPIYSYTGSGPRSIQFSFTLHRDLMKQLNYGVSNIQVSEMGLNDDYVDTMIKYLQAMVVPSYEDSSKMINPPIVALKFGTDIFIKGIINGSVGLTYKPPILSNGKYAIVDVGFGITEIDPFDAKEILNVGSYRGVSNTLDRKIYNRT